MTWYGREIPHTGDRLSNFDRVKVDVAQTSFFEGKEFRTYKELNIPATSVYVIRLVTPINIQVNSLIANIDQGNLRLRTVRDGVAGGTYAENLPLIGRNNMSIGSSKRANYVPQVALTAGGTVTGGTEIDVLRVRTSGGLTSRGSSIGNAVGDERGAAASTFFLEFTNLSVTEAVTGVFSLTWEERP